MKTLLSAVILATGLIGVTATAADAHPHGWHHERHRVCVRWVTTWHHHHRETHCARWAWRW